MKKVLAFVLVVAVGVTFIAAQKTTTGNGNAASVATGTYLAAQTDTVKWYREKGVRTLAFGAFYADSGTVGTAFVRRVVNGVCVSAVAGDTLTNLTAKADTSTTDKSSLDAITLAPLADEYWVIVNYTGIPIAAKAVRYEFIKGY